MRNFFKGVSALFQFYFTEKWANVLIFIWKRMHGGDVKQHDTLKGINKDYNETQTLWSCALDIYPWGQQFTFKQLNSVWQLRISLLLHMTAFFCAFCVLDYKHE